MPQDSAELCLTQEPLSPSEWEVLQDLLRFCADGRRRFPTDYEILSMIARFESAIYRQLARVVQ
jgi:hypothetical protein